MKKLKLGMVGGGQGGFIGGVHRFAARLDGRFELVAGALSSNAERAHASGVELGLNEDRIYSDFNVMAKAEAAREDGIDAVSIVTPNNLHAAPVIAFLEAGINVICDKPLAATQAEADAILAATKASSARFFLTHNYTGYPLMRQAREMIARGDLGEIRIVQAEYIQDWLADKIEDEGQKQASWRTDPKQAGAGAIGDIGTHAFNLANFVSGLNVSALSAELSSFVNGRMVDDNAHISLRYEGGARGQIWVSQVAIGNETGLRLRIIGDKGALDWSQENPNMMAFTRHGEPKQILTRGGAGQNDAERWTRIPPGHPEGYLEGFANLYSDIADVILGHDIDVELPDIHAGIAGMWFIAACQKSSENDGAWINIELSH